MSVPAASSVLIALAASLVGAGLVWYAAQALQRGLQISHAASRYWLGAWLCAVLPPVLALLLPLQHAPLPQLTSALPVALNTLPQGMLPDTAATPGIGMSLAAVLPLCLWVVYAGGVLLSLVRWALATRQLHAVLQRSQPLQATQLPGPQSRQAVRQLQAAGIAVRCTEGGGTPFAVGWPDARIVLPAASLALPDRALRLVIGHEAAHLHRHDPLRAILMRLVAALYWFNPFVQRLAARVQLAAELQCDARALAEAPVAGDGRLLAQAYLETLRQATALQPASALSHRDPGGHQLRLRHMLQGDAGRRPGTAIALLLAASGVTATLGLATVQAAVTAGPPSLALPLHSASVTLLEPTLPPAPIFAAPLAHARVTSVFGHTSDFRQRAHRGVDFAARRGTAVQAPADGTIIAATRTYPDGPNYGTVVVIDHGGGWQTLFAHLQDYDVDVGQQVRQGDVIARTGNTGRTTGPHLHMELLRSGTRVDPQAWMQ
ncbi:M23/M56 family metallopeptidase [Stenotrophomonas sp. NPDC077659]|uniref:M23/M56 family metallopeptidase n=1 Tax=Stenotrophomonas sp. NPDC077659 TaxID=3390694 RepID=UPI003CFD739D